MACNYHRMDEIHAEASQGVHPNISVELLLEIKDMRASILDAALTVRLQKVEVETLKILCKRALGEPCMIHPGTLGLYLGHGVDTEESRGQLDVLLGRLHKRSGYTRSKLFEYLMPLNDKKQIAEAIEALKALADARRVGENGIGPATPPPDN
jgi:hypothetical protein